MLADYMEVVVASNSFLTLLHNPSDIVAQLLADGNLAVQVTDPTKYPDWSVYAGGEPDVPDNCITVYDVEGQPDGKLMPTGELMCHYGLKFRIRSTSSRNGGSKARALRAFLATVSQLQVVVTNDQGTGIYNVWSFDHIGQPLALGTESPKSKRFLFTLNCVSPIAQVS